MAFTIRPMGAADIPAAFSVAKAATHVTAAADYSAWQCERWLDDYSPGPLAAALSAAATSPTAIAPLIPVVEPGQPTGDGRSGDGGDGGGGDGGDGDDGGRVVVAMAPTAMAAAGETAASWRGWSKSLCGRRPRRRFLASLRTPPTGGAGTAATCWRPQRGVPPPGGLPACACVRQRRRCRSTASGGTSSTLRRGRGRPSSARRCRCSGGSEGVRGVGRTPGGAGVSGTGPRGGVAAGGRAVWRGWAWHTKPSRFHVVDAAGRRALLMSTALTRATGQTEYSFQGRRSQAKRLVWCEGPCVAEASWCHPPVERDTQRSTAHRCFAHD